MKPFYVTNQHGQSYYLHRKRRSDGQVVYVLRTSATNALGALPDSLEVREHVHGRVSVRRRRARPISESETDLLGTALAQSRPFAYRLDIDGRAATIYASADDRRCFSESLEADFAEGFSQALRTLLTKRYSAELIEMFRTRREEKRNRRPRYYPLMRFVLADRERRLFSVERVCFTGESSWIRLQTLSLPAALMKYLPHLGRDSFFDLL
jgi:hypothetical protein